MVDKTTNPEVERLTQAGHQWKTWGPYLSERQWGTVREDYSLDGAAWDYFPHDHARSRAYRWGEDGIGGWSDDRQLLCLAIALWNGQDPILKERLYGLTNEQANHGEDVKELYYYLDATPSHSYAKMLYKYPQAAFPYELLTERNSKRSKLEPEYELVDTGIFRDSRYFDVEIEYAQRKPGEVFLRVTAYNRGPEAAEIHLLPHLWLRNTWDWDQKATKPHLEQVASDSVKIYSDELKDRYGGFQPGGTLLYCENETDPGRHFNRPHAVGSFKDAFHKYVINGDTKAISTQARGTKCASHYSFTLAPGEHVAVRAYTTTSQQQFSEADIDNIFSARIREANVFYEQLQQSIDSGEHKNIHRQALAGMIWSKQFYYFDVSQWLDGDPAQPEPPIHRQMGRNSDWRHLECRHILSMPDTWEYPWFAAWDLAFHCIPLALVDAQFAKDQLVLLTREWYMHPNGQIPAYEWAFGDVNPPVHAWATWRVFQIDRKQRGGHGDIFFLERVFHKLLLNFTWWVNRKDAHGEHIFQGGFLGLDNIGIFDRSTELPTGGHLDQSDGTAWMAMYCLNLMRIALELALHNKVYEDIATKFFEHFLYIAKAMNDTNGTGLWDEQDGFYYDVLDFPERNGQRASVPLRIRSMVGLIPLFAVETLEPAFLAQLPDFSRRMEWFLDHRPDLRALVSHWEVPGQGQRRLLSLLRGHRMKCLLRYMLHEKEFLSLYGIRSLSKIHQDSPFSFKHNGTEFSVEYSPAESTTHLFGGNSNWRGPIWMPLNYLIIESLQKFHHYYGDEFRVECPTGSQQFQSLLDISQELSMRLVRIFEPDASGRRPVFGDQVQLQDDPLFSKYLLFYEYFHGDLGRGIGASHQTGWTGLVAKLIQSKSLHNYSIDLARQGTSSKKS
ncbi:MAG: glucosidase [Myxococcales bacterium]|nr:glucosidase [Myxococcales bacterium]